MRFREPVVEVPKERRESSVETWSETYEVKTITPVYGGGVRAGEIDRGMPVRVSAIKGQLRFWWRLLASQRQDAPLKEEALYKSERDLWGGMSDGNHDFSSQVIVRIKAKGGYATIPSDTAANNKPELKYALFSAISNNSVLLKQGYKFELNITLPRKLIIVNDERVPEPLEVYQAKKKSVEQSLRWWCNFGGVGARTRRGLGSVAVKGIAAISEDEVRSYGMTLKAKNSGIDALIAWKEAVGPMYKLRQGKNIGRNEGRDSSNKNKLGRSFWPEPDSIRELTRKHSTLHEPVHKARVSFPRAAYGLPIIFEFRGDNNEPPKTELTPVGAERMASPLILKARSVEGNRYQPVVLCLPTGHLKGLNVLLKNNQSGRDIDTSEHWPLDLEAQEEKASATQPIFNHQGKDAITAFLNYFSKGQ